MAGRENPFPFPVRCISDLPESFQGAIYSSIGPDEPVHSILILPPQPFLKTGGVPRQALLTTGRGILHVREGDPPLATFLPAESLLYVRQTLVLLYGRLELVGEIDNRRVQILAEFNTVGQNFLDAALRQFLSQSYYGVTTDESSPDQNNHLLEKLGFESFKLMSGLRLYALQPGERLLDYVLQPRISEYLFGFLSHPVVPASLFALTNKAVVLIEEAKSRGSSYGWVVTLCPRNVVQAVDHRSIKAWESLRVHLLRNQVGEERNLLLTHETAAACLALWMREHEAIFPSVSSP